MCSGIQAPINGALGKKVGGFEGAFVSFFIGTVFLAFIVTFFGRGQLGNVFSVPKWQLIGGFVGALFVTAVILAVPNIGVAMAIFATIVGQMIISMVIDHFGFFGTRPIPINWNRVLGFVFMLAALFFIYRGSFE
ncbi:DMT family transporter [Pseudalkalibacillus caeni]|uniref:DMT family transporter n=2 Tax=Exobacillus caeni TaxID=2574798 RepID=A0A5R9EZD1_9BACL|nr:DMT family transporter [Pseudalkalibacillus caeni]